VDSEGGTSGRQHVREVSIHSDVEEGGRGGGIGVESGSVAA
jgi:hypothetical protein